MSEECLGFFCSGERENEKRNVHEEKRRRNCRFRVCFAYLRQICCLVNDTEGSPLTNWGAPGRSGKRVRVCNDTRGQLLGVYERSLRVVRQRSESLRTLFLRPYIPLCPSVPRASFFIFPLTLVKLWTTFRGVDFFVDAG